MTFARIALPLLLIALVLPARAQEGSYLRIGTNAAAIALGDAHVALSRDAFATYWNPAGLAGGGEASAAATHHVWAGDVRGYTVVARLGAGRQGGFGLFGSGFVSDESATGSGTVPGVADNRFVNAGVAYGHRLGPVRAGVALKYLSERYTIYEANGVAGDIGLQADLSGGTLRFGAAVQNVGRLSSEAAREDVALHPTLRAGVAVFPFRVRAADDGSRLLDAFATAEISRFRRYVTEQFSVRHEPVTRLHLGAGAELFELVTVRGGYVTDDELRGISVGVGLRYESLQLDHAFVPFGEGYGAGHVLTLMYRW